MCDFECDKGDICIIDVLGKHYRGVVIDILDATPSFECKSAEKCTDYFLSYQKLLATFIAQYYCVGLGSSYGLFIPQTLGNKALESTRIQPPYALSQEQNKAFIFCQTHKNPLLFGDTGSGKTEIYIHLIADTLSKSQNALFLMPEIALTPQMESRLIAVFGDMVGIWHSKVTQAQKKRILNDLHNGKIRIVAGARSALFLPINDLGLVIIDEEHDDAYKSQSIPCYNVRDIALYLGSKSEVKVVLGSATPSVVSYYHAAKSGNMYRLRGQYYLSNKSITFFPSIQNQDGITDECISKISQTIYNKGQVIVFLPTRANYKMLVCSKCGSGCECDFCSVNMSLHLDKNALICHYCHFSKLIPKVCPQCKHDSLHTCRIGTAQVAKDLAQALPQARIALFDRDNITTHKKLKNTLKAFNDGEIDVLVGTQMLSKGHDYHRVNLAIVLGIDYILKSSDYRCNERAVSLLHQIAGRSGRKHNGEVYIQSANSAFFKAFINDYEDFLRFELQTRPNIYPPYQRLALLTFSHKKEHIALANLTKVMTFLQKTHFDGVEIVGESKAILGRLYDKYRFVLLIRSKSIRNLLELLHTLCANTTLKGYDIDLDPVSII